ncbi:hypothetical protein P8452_54962 [Trifolium repens]|nr:hypothetical protein P8452_54962 [Trifolium repens]
MLLVVLEFKVYVYNFKDFKVIRQVDTFRNPKGLCVVSQLADSTVLVCHGLQKGQVRVDHYAKKKINYGWAHDLSLACFGLMIDGKLIRVFDTENGLFPNRIPNREDKTTMKTITKVVLDNKVYLGIVFDIDVDRSAAVDSTGCEFNRNRLIGLMAVIVLEEMILHPSRKERRRKKSDNSAPESTSSQSDDSDRSRRSGHRSDRRSRRRRSRHESDSESSSDDSGSDRDGRKRKSSRKITEEEVAQYLAKKAQRKALKVAKKLKTNIVSGYSNDSNPFGDSNLNENLAVVEVNKATVGAFPGAIEALVAILRDGKGRERKEAATALYALCCFCDNRKRAVDCGVVPILLRSVECGLERGVEVIGLLVKCKEGREQLESYGGCVKILVHVLRNGSSRSINEIWDMSSHLTALAETKLEGV